MTPQSKASSSRVAVTALPSNEYGPHRAINITGKVKAKVLLPLTLKECLAPHHVCTQEYHDFTGAYRIRCDCMCHNEEAFEVNQVHSPLSGVRNFSPQACVVDSLAENDDNDIHERIDHGAGTHWDKIRRDILA